MNRRMPADLRLQLKSELAALQELEETEGVARDYLRFCGKVVHFHAHSRAAIRVVQSAAPGGGEARTANARAANARAANARAANARAPDESTRRLSRDVITFDSALLLRFLGELKALSRESASDDGDLVRLAAASVTDPTVLTTLAESVAEEGAIDRLAQLAARTGVSVAALVVVGRMLASPFLHEARHRRGARPELDTRELEPEQAVRCPSCGAAPSMASLDPSDGCRHLSCSLCGESWIAPRVLCPFCGSRLGLGTLRSTAH
ncbi:MAG: formate dehydrogenase accessory protein FdhE, partial [Gemmatimonadaceae bacterium]